MFVVGVDSTLQSFLLKMFPPLMLNHVDVMRNTAATVTIIFIIDSSVDNFHH